MLGNQISLTNNVAKQVISVTATQGQTDFTVEGGYRINQLGVYRNGVRLVDGRDFIARNGATVTLLSQGANGDDAMEFVVFDDFRVADALSVNSGGTVNASVNITGALQMGTGTSIFSPATNELAFETNNNQRIRIDSAGNVGINESDPLAKLHIDGSGDAPCLILTDSNNSRFSTGFGNTNVGGVGQRLDFYAGDSGSNTANLTSAARRMSLTSQGRLGIGTTNPSANLEVIGGIKATNTTGSATVNIESQNNQLSGVHFSDDAATLGKIEYFHADNSLRFNTNGSERLSILSSGNIGIATHTPGRTLHVNSTLNNPVRIQSSATYSRIEFESSSTTQSDNVSIGAGGNDFRIFTGTSGGSTRAIVKADGTVGINTVIPSAKLQVAGSVMFGPEGTGQYQGIQLLNGRDSSANVSTGFVDFRNNLNIPDAHMFVDHQTDGGSTIIFGTTPAGDRTTDRRAERFRIDPTGAVTKATNPCLKTLSGSTFGSAGNLHTSPAVSVLQANTDINIGDTGWTTSGTNAYSFVCPVTGIYAVHAHISLGNITENVRTIWSMAYTLGGGDFPLSSYVEVIDVVVDDYMNYSYYEDWYFTAGTRVAMGKNSSGSQPGYNFHWGIRLVQ